MTKYIDIGNIGDYLLEEWLEPLGLSRNALANAIGVPANRITNIVNGKTGISVDTDLRLCKYFGMSEGHFLRMQEHLERTIAKRGLQKQLDKIIPINAANENCETRGLLSM
ncbi:MAG: HigA family addiction module antidote protein [Rickettsiales bacterium]|jgi:addiction module HigA family antidote|nr:HigA family addiction module antidote protein [Rickettsiales bacterium]